MKKVLLFIFGAGVLLPFILWIKYGSTDHRMGFDLTASAKAAAQRIAGDEEFQILREQPQIFVKSFDEVSLKALVNQVISDKYSFRIGRPKRTYHFRIVVEGKAYYWSFSEREFLPTIKPGIWDTNKSLLIHMARKCSIFHAMSDKDRNASYEQTRTRFNVPVDTDSYCRD